VSGGWFSERDAVRDEAPWWHAFWEYALLLGVIGMVVYLVVWLV
jgi:hypothetical protein